MTRGAFAGISLSIIVVLMVGGCDTVIKTARHIDSGSKLAETHRVAISQAADLQSLVATDTQAETVLTLLTEMVASRINNATFTLAFRAPTGEPMPGEIVGTDGFVLESIAECGGIVRDGDREAEGAGCTHVFPPSLAGLETLLHPERYRGMQCGNIATIHSVVKLGLIEESAAYDGDYLSRDQVRALNHYHHFRGDEIGMNWEELQDAHKSYAAAGDIECIYPLHARTASPSVGGLLDTAAHLLGSQNRPMDCSLETNGDYGTDGNPRISHVEHITAMRRTPAGTWEIMTLDGFDQGTSDATIPKTPETNTWEFGPGIGRFKNGSKENLAQFGQIAFEDIRINCCYGPERQ